VAPPRTGVRARRTVVEGKLGLPGSLWLVPLALAAVYLIVFAVGLPHDVAELGWNSSVGSAYVMPETLARTGTDGLAVMGSTGQWVALWFGLATAGLPLHRELWGVAPTLLFVATALLVGWSVLRVSDRRAALLAVLIGLLASSPALGFLMAPFSHNVVFPCTALLGAYLVWLTRAQGRRRVSALAAPPLLGVIAGTCLSSDVLLASTAMIPLAITAILAAVRGDRRARIVALSALTTVVVAIPVAKLTSTTMGSLGYVTLPTPLKLAALSELPARAKLLLEGLQSLFGGYLGGPEGPGALHAPLGEASNVVMAATLLTLLALGVRGIVALLAPGSRAGAHADARADADARAGSDARAALTPAQLARSLHVVYWVGSAATACAAFWLAGEGTTATHYSYYDTVIFAAAAVVPLLLSSGAPARWAIWAGATVFFAAGVVGLTSDFMSGAPPLERYARTIAKIAAADHVQVGYSNWADAEGLTWGTHDRVIARPVVECPTAQGVSLCPGFQTYVRSWYVPHERRTFLLVEANGVDLASVPPGLGKPLASYSFESMRMYVYPYDVASRFAFASG
jgi:hypothetical protein